MQYINAWRITNQDGNMTGERLVEFYDSLEKAVDQVVEQGSIWYGRSGDRYQYDYTIQVNDDAKHGYMGTATVIDIEDMAKAQNASNALDRRHNNSLRAGA